MFQKSSVVNSTTGNNSKLEPDPHSGSTPGLPASNCNERITLAPNFRDKQYVNYHPSNRPKEESKSHHHHHRLRNSNSHSLSQQSQMVHSTNNHEMQASSNLQGRSNQQSFNQRSGHNGTHMVRSSTNLQIYQNPNLLSSTQHQDAPLPQSSHLDIAARLFNSARPSESPSSSAPARVSQSYTTRQRSSSNSTLREETKPAHGQRQDNQQDRDDTVTMIREEMEELASAFKESELETLGSLEKNLPVELSFLIRQQAYCMARMNYLDRQIRELKETKQSVPQQANQQLMNHRTHNAGSTLTNVKNGNGFIPSDDSGGEYSRATISDEDELSSLLDQIAKSVKPERHINHQSLSGNQQQLNNRASYSVLSSQPQQYAIINPGHMHAHPAATAVPVFVMGSPIAMAHPSSINSNILPGVHFQPEPRYNQYYEDFYIQNGNGISNNDSNSTPSMINTRHINHGTRNPRPQPNTSQFETSISAIEQLVSQKEKRQIRSQLKSADNWLKMRSATMCNLNEDFCNDKSELNDELAGDAGVLGARERSKSHQMGSGTGVATENSNSVVEESETNR